MSAFISYSKEIEQILYKIVCCNRTHAKWLNTLSYLENCGARKIAACEHPTLVKEEMLKHAAEEFRHAHYLKRQIERVSEDSLENYTLENILGSTDTLRYLQKLDVQTSRYLKQVKMGGRLKEAAYIFVTYAIELRAAELYPIYENVLRNVGSKVTVKSILLEEKEHLAEMKEGILKIPNGFVHAEKITAIESALFAKWLSFLGVY